MKPFDGRAAAHLVPDVRSGRRLRGLPPMKPTCTPEFHAGFSAYCDGQDESTCPHDPGTPAARQWIRGYRYPEG